MTVAHWKTRWVWGPIETDSTGQKVPAVRNLVQQWLCPADGLHDTQTLTFCLMDVGQLAVVRADSRFIVLDSLHNTKDNIHTDISGKLSGKGVKANMNTHDLLKHLSQFHPAFEPEV